MLAVVTAAATLSRPSPAALPPIHEEFDPFLSALNSVDELMLVLDTAYPGATALEKLDAADALLRRRFVHEYSFYRFNQNWAAASLRPIWSDLASPVDPDDILAFRRAACSQQSLVFLEVARRLGFDYAAVGAPHHFMAAVKIDGQWRVYDANREIRVRHYPFEWLLTGDRRLTDIYEPELAAHLLAGARAGANQLRDVNRFAAPQALMLHRATALFSRFGWLVVLTLWGLLRLASATHAPGRIGRSEVVTRLAAA